MPFRFFGDIHILNP